MAIRIDSRLIEPGDIFIPVKGPNHDGHDFIPDVIAKGGQVKDVDLFAYARHYRKQLKAHVIGITGSYGKTTLKDRLAAMLGQKFNVHKTHQNENNEYGVPLTILNADANTEILIVEMAMRHSGEIAELAQIVRPTHVVLTGVGFSHIEHLKSFRNIARAKAEIFRKPLGWERKKSHGRFAWINMKSRHYDLLEKKASQAEYRVFPYGAAEGPEQTLEACQLIGRHFGLSEAQVHAGLAAYQASPHRLTLVEKNGLKLIDDTYNANPDAVTYALRYTRQFSGRKIFVFGDMLELGNFKNQAYQQVADAALDNEISMIFAFGADSQILESQAKVPVLHFENKENLIQSLKSEIKKGDVVLVKGSRGMKMEEVVNAVFNS